MRKFLILVIMVLLLGGCERAQNALNQKTDATIISSDSLNDSFYPVYMSSTVSDLRDSYYYHAITNPNDYKLLGRELQIKSLKYFSNQNHYFQEGQYLKLRDMDALLVRNREGTSNEHSLQPLFGDIIGNVETPTMISTIFETNFLIYSNGEYQLNGMSLAIALNPRTMERESLTSPMDDEVIYEFAVLAAEKLFKYLREELAIEVPIYIGFYLCATELSDHSGRYIGGVYSGEVFGSPERYYEEQVIFPSSHATSIDQGTANEFSLIRSSLKQGAYEAIGVVGQAYYKESTIHYLNIQVTMNTKTYTESVTIIQYIADLIDQKLSEGYDVQVFVYSQDRLVGIVHRMAGQKVKSTLL